MDSIAQGGIPNETVKTVLAGIFALAFKRSVLLQVTANYRPILRRWVRLKLGCRRLRLPIWVDTLKGEAPFTVFCTREARSHSTALLVP